MKKPGKIAIGVGLGVVVGIVSLAFLLLKVMDMHNRLPVSVCLLYPYVAIIDRWPHPPNSLMAVVVAWTLAQMPLYGGLLGRDWLRGRFSWPTLALLAAHLGAALYAVALTLHWIGGSV
ncbi:MAG TPA: hypothetical protein VI279_05855 [Rhodocyclaceae bacterium]